MSICVCLWAPSSATATCSLIVPHCFLFLMSRLTKSLKNCKHRKATHTYVLCVCVCVHASLNSPVFFPLFFNPLFTHNRQREGNSFIPAPFFTFANRFPSVCCILKWTILCAGMHFQFFTYLWLCQFLCSPTTPTTHTPLAAQATGWRKLTFLELSG